MANCTNLYSSSVVLKPLSLYRKMTVFNVLDRLKSTLGQSAHHRSWFSSLYIHMRTLSYSRISILIHYVTVTAYICLPSRNFGWLWIIWQMCSQIEGFAYSLMRSTPWNGQLFEGLCAASSGSGVPTKALTRQECWRTACTLLLLKNAVASKGESPQNGELGEAIARKHDKQVLPPKAQSWLSNYCPGSYKAEEQGSLLRRFEAFKASLTQPIQLLKLHIDDTQELNCQLRNASQYLVIIPLNCWYE